METKLHKGLLRSNYNQYSRSVIYVKHLQKEKEVRYLF